MFLSLPSVPHNTTNIGNKKSLNKKLTLFPLFHINSWSISETWYRPNMRYLKEPPSPWSMVSKNKKKRQKRKDKKEKTKKKRQNSFPFTLISQLSQFKIPSWPLPMFGGCKTKDTHLRWGLRPLMRQSRGHRWKAPTWYPIWLVHTDKPKETSV